MTKEMSARIMLVLSVLYGVTVGVLAALDGPVSLFALIGGMTLGVLWVARSLVLRR